LMVQTRETGHKVNGDSTRGSSKQKIKIDRSGRGYESLAFVGSNGLVASSTTPNFCL
jgi:hypothetical protein